MKFLLALVSFVFISSVSAQEFTNLAEGDVVLSNAKAELVSVKAICPKVPGRVSCMAYGSQATIKVRLNGCLDRLGGHFHDFKMVGNKAVLSFGAINIANEGSRVAMCVAIPHKIVKVFIPYEGKVQFEAMEFRGTEIAE